MIGRINGGMPRHLLRRILGEIHEKIKVEIPEGILGRVPEKIYEKKLQQIHEGITWIVLKGKI